MSVSICIVIFVFFFLFYFVFYNKYSYTFLRRLSFVCRSFVLAVSCKCRSFFCHLLQSSLILFQSLYLLFDFFCFGLVCFLPLFLYTFVLEACFFLTAFVCLCLILLSFSPVCCVSMTHATYISFFGFFVLFVQSISLSCICALQQFKFSHVSTI